MEGKNEHPNNKERLSLERSRTISDGELLKEGAEYILDSKGNIILHPTEPQKRSMTFRYKPAPIIKERDKEKAKEGIKENDLRRGDVVEFKRIDGSTNLLWLTHVHYKDPKSGYVAWAGIDSFYRPDVRSVSEMIRVVGHNEEHLRQAAKREEEKNRPPYYGPFPL